MKIFLATDHTGLEIKDKIKLLLQQKGYDVEDCGAYTYDEDDDYPDFISKAAEKVSENSETNLGIIFGGSGQGEAITANKYKGVRCAVFYSLATPLQEINIEGRESTDPFEILKLTREHNAANMLSIGTRFLRQEDIEHAVITWIGQPAATVLRHIRRVKKIKNIEDQM